MTVLGAFALYEITTSIIAYTGDAYVTSDLVALAPEVTGRIIEVKVIDNQTVQKGDLLALIDPVPFQLAADQRRAEVDEAAKQVTVDQDMIATARDTLASATSAAEYALETQNGWPAWKKRRMFRGLTSTEAMMRCAEPTRRSMRRGRLSRGPRPPPPCIGRRRRGRWRLWEPWNGN